MRIHSLINMVFLCNAVLSPLCMAASMGDMDRDEDHAAHMAHETTPQGDNDCAGHCITQAKNVTVSSGVFSMIILPAGLPVQSPVPHFSAMHEPAPAPLATSPPHIPSSTIVLRL